MLVVTSFVHCISSDVVPFCFIGKKILTLTLLLVSSGGSCGLRQACATLMTCSSFRGCSSTLAAKNRVVGEMICDREQRVRRVIQAYL